MPFSTLSRRGLVGVLLAGATLVCACGARGPLDIIVVEEPVDASASDVVLDGRPDHEADATPDVPDARADAVEDALDSSMGVDGGPLANCGSCIANTCGTPLFTCITAPGCGAALQCVFTTCLTAGGNPLGCLSGCAMGNAMTQSELLGVLGCIIGSCSMPCQGLLSGGGIGGGG